MEAENEQQAAVPADSSDSDESDAEPARQIDIVNEIELEENLRKAHTVQQEPTAAKVVDDDDQVVEADDAVQSAQAGE